MCSWRWPAARTDRRGSGAAAASGACPGQTLRIRSGRPPRAAAGTRRCAGHLLVGALDLRHRLAELTLHLPVELLDHRQQPATELPDALAGAAHELLRQLLELAQQLLGTHRRVARPLLGGELAAGLGHGLLEPLEHPLEGLLQHPGDLGDLLLGLLGDLPGLPPGPSGRRRHPTSSLVKAQVSQTSRPRISSAGGAIVKSRGWAMMQRQRGKGAGCERWRGFASAPSRGGLTLEYAQRYIAT